MVLFRLQILIFHCLLGSQFVRICGTLMPSPVKCSLSKESDNDNGKQYKYVCITSNQPDVKSNPNPNTRPNPTTKQHALVAIQQNIVTMSYVAKFIRDSCVASFLLVSAVTSLSFFIDCCRHNVHAFRITFGFMGVTGFLSMWLANIPTTAMMIPIASAVVKALDDHRMLVRQMRRNKRRTCTCYARLTQLPSYVLTHSVGCMRLFVSTQFVLNTSNKPNRKFVTVSVSVLVRRSGTIFQRGGRGSR